MGVFEALKNLVGPLQPVLSVFNSLYADCEEIRIRKHECRGIAERAGEILTTVNQQFKNTSAEKWASPDVKKTVDNLEEHFTSIRDKMREMARWNILKCVLRSDEIKKAIQESHRRLDTICQTVVVSFVLDVRYNQSVAEDLRKEDTKVLEQLLSEARRDADLIRALQIGVKQQVDAMRAMQQALATMKGDSVERKILKAGLGALQNSTGVILPKQLPPWHIAWYDIDIHDDSESELGRGGFGTVKKGIWKGQTVAVKQMAKQAPPEMLLAEIEVWHRLDHQHILPFLGASELADPPFMVSSYMENGNAIEFLRCNPGTNRTLLLHQVALGMEYLHQQHIIHGDLKGSNILIDEKGNARIADFGLSRMVRDIESTLPKIERRAVPGTLRFMAPEQMVDRESLPASDVYSYGMLIYQIFTDSNPFMLVPDDEIITLIAVKHERLERPEGDEALSRGLTDEMWNLVYECSAPIPTARPKFGDIRRKTLALYELTLQPPKYSEAGKDVLVDAHPADAGKTVLVRALPDAGKTVLVEARADAGKSGRLEDHPEAGKTVLVEAHPEVAKPVRVEDRPKAGKTVLVEDRPGAGKAVLAEAHSEATNAVLVDAHPNLEHAVLIDAPWSPSSSISTLVSEDEEPEATTSLLQSPEPSRPTVTIPTISISSADSVAPIGFARRPGPSSMQSRLSILEEDTLDFEMLPSPTSSDGQWSPPSGPMDAIDDEIPLLFNLVYDVDMDFLPHMELSRPPSPEAPLFVEFLEGIYLSAEPDDVPVESVPADFSDLPEPTAATPPLVVPTITSSQSVRPLPLPTASDLIAESNTPVVDGSVPRPEKPNRPLPGLPGSVSPVSPSAPEVITALSFAYAPASKMALHARPTMPRRLSGKLLHASGKPIKATRPIVTRRTSSGLARAAGKPKSSASKPLPRMKRVTRELLRFSGKLKSFTSKPMSPGKRVSREVLRAVQQLRISTSQPPSPIFTPEEDPHLMNPTVEEEVPVFTQSFLRVGMDSSRPSSMVWSDTVEFDTSVWTR